MEQINAAVSVLRQNLDALTYKLDRANQELNTMHKRRELLLHEIDRCTTGISEIKEALHRLNGSERSS